MLLKMIRAVSTTTAFVLAPSIVRYRLRYLVILKIML
jgi:hypothetical protein